jgi:heme/copper-type cytochrome/quinol oxidase subunit 2
MYGSYVLLGSYILLAIWIIGFVTTLRKRLSCMAGMMAAMALGMSMGLGIGTLIAFLLPDQFFQSAMMSMLIGGLIGTLAGLPISIMAVLDGMLAGIMGGMMGAMLTIMVPASDLNPALKIMAVLCYGITFILLIMLQSEVKADHLSQKSFIFSKPFPMFLVICMCLSLIFQSTIIENGPNNNLAYQTDSSPPPITSPTSKHNHADTNNTVTPTNKNDEELHIVATDYSFSLQTINLNSKQTVRITLENKGKVEHDFEIPGTAIHVHAGPGKSSSTLATFKNPGQYKAVCTLPGHKEAGMISIVNIS